MNLREAPVSRVVATLEFAGLAGNGVLEVGAGDSSILIARWFRLKLRSDSAGPRSASEVKKCVRALFRRPERGV